MRWLRVDSKGYAQMASSLLRVSKRSIFLAGALFVGLNLRLQNGVISKEDIRGAVIDADSGAPVESAVVHLEWIISSGDEFEQTTTDANGHFEFGEIPKAQYKIRAEKSGYVSLFANSSPIRIPDSGSEVRLPLVRACAITGRVFDPQGEPKRGLKIVAMSRRLAGPQSRLQTEGVTVRSDDRGEFRLYGLRPGVYTLALLPADDSNLANAPPMYFPGVTDVGRAEFFQLHSGDTYSDAEMFLPAMRTQQLQGTVVGIPAEWGERSVGVSLLSVSEIGNPFQSVFADKEGHFLFPLVPLGSYRLLARGPVIARGRSGPTLGSHPRQGVVSVDVTESEGAPVTISILPGVDVKLKSSLDAANTLSTACFANAAISLTPVDPALAFASLRMTLSREVSIVHDVPVGEYTVHIESRDNPCVLQEVAFGEQRGPTLDINNENETLALILTTSTGNVSGRVVGKDGSPKAAIQVILAPSDEVLLETSDSHIRTTQSDQDGSFTLNQVPPGAYRILAVTLANASKYLAPFSWEEYHVPEIQIRGGTTVKAELKITQ